MRVNEKNQLKPCPFCGERVRETPGVLQITTMFVCMKCGATVSFRGSEYDPGASEAWNRRADNET